MSTKNFSRTTSIPTLPVGEGEGGEGKVTFTPEQQAKIDQIIKERTAVAGAEARTAAEAARAEAKAAKEQLDSLTAELATLKANKKGGKTGGDTDAEIERLTSQIAEMRAAGESTKSEVERLRQVVATKEKEVETARQQSQDIKKKIAMREAASKANFLEPDVVTSLTDQEVKWDEGRGRWIVLNENGTERLNAAYEPMTLDEFYQEYASKKPYMVRGDVRSGAGSTESNRGISNNGKYTVEQIFGPKSVGALAMKLYKENPAEYARLKVIAREGGLIS